MFFFIFVGKDAIILTDSLGRDFPTMKKIQVVALRGATLPKAMEYLQKNMHLLKNKRVIVLHLGTNHFGSKEVWFLYLKMQRNEISKADYASKLSHINPPTANGHEDAFRDQYTKLIKFIQTYTDTPILVYSILLNYRCVEPTMEFWRNCATWIKYFLLPATNHFSTIIF